MIGCQKPTDTMGSDVWQKVHVSQQLVANGKEEREGGRTDGPRKRIWLVFYVSIGVMLLPDYSCRNIALQGWTKN